MAARNRKKEGHELNEWGKARIKWHGEKWWKNSR
jgi:hypothetical protein